ncbi:MULTISPECIES: hypothetical protein [unclassified Polaribacter]|jgi:hypothetical protein|uniref:hypothetical protein n=1 Tax=unclassified Polaribacter TaxID=196858 RepID=UPI00052DD18C|nr:MULTISPECIES: hypothetical protein [unclassified Polaribacter]KGL61660.1 hypothetical protein PHEL49_2570 [Polaribacter sp. Hel1_33_49]PKV64378.1 hypothetical protein ATE90_0760 [Polaribacter sp. Hel1_33_96]
MNKKTYLKSVIFILTLFFSITLSAQSETEAIATSSQEISKTEILEKCLDILDLQQHLAKNTDGSFLPIHIMQYPITFSNNLNLSKFDEAIVFQSRQEISSNNVKSFFIFKVLTIDGDTAQVEFDYYNNTKEPQLVEIKTSLNKSVSEWEIVNSTLNKK